MERPELRPCHNRRPRATRWAPVGRQRKGEGDAASARTGDRARDGGGGGCARCGRFRRLDELRRASRSGRSEADSAALVSGFAADLARSADGARPAGPRAAGTAAKRTSHGCPVNRGANVRVNQNCLNLSTLTSRAAGRRRTRRRSLRTRTTRPASSPRSNDYRRGDGNCYAYYSSDGGRSWQDSTPPMSFTRGTGFGGVARQYWQAGGDTSVAFDTRGNAYLSCQMFIRGSRCLQQPGRVERVLRLPLDRHGRRVVELPGAAGGRAQRRRRQRRRSCSTSSY